jgi:predicted lipid-binding transport protein (Tim44 family)
MRTLACLAATAGVVLLTSAEVCAQAGRYNSLLRLLQAGVFKPPVPGGGVRRVPVHVPAEGGVHPVHVPVHAPVHVPVHGDREIGSPDFWWPVLVVIAVLILAVICWKIGTAIGRGKTPAPQSTPGSAGADWRPPSAHVRQSEAPQGTPGASRAKFPFPIPSLEDLILSAKEVEPTALRTRRLLEELARRDPALDPSSLDAFIRGTFLNVQRCWEERDYRPVRDLLVPSLLAEHDKLLQAMRHDGLINHLENLGVRRLEFVHAFSPEATDAQQVTALITFDARVYFVDEKTGEYVHGAMKVLPYQEYWVFCRQGDSWRVRTIDRDQADHRGLRARAVA